MDARLLADPAFWTDAAPFAPGNPDRSLRDIEDLAGMVLFATSGSSGSPKLIALSKSALLVSAAAVNHHLRVNEESCWGLALPWHHVGGFGVIARAYEAGCRMARFEPRWQPVGFRAWLAAAGVTHTSLVPTQVHDLVTAGLSAPPALQAVVVGGGHFDTATGRAARALGWPVLASYGMTEAGSQIATASPDLLDAPYQLAPLEILPIWDTRLTPDGRLEIAGPALFAGMMVWQGTAWAFQRRDDEWYTTADHAALAGNCLTPLGRADDGVKVLGELVSPALLTREVLDHGAGALRPDSLIVVAEPDERAGHRLVPVFERGAPPAAAESAVAAYNAQAAGYRRLQPIRWVDDLPRGPLGKVRKIT